MKITILTLFPKMISGFFEESIVRRAIEKKLVEVELINLRDFAVDSYGSVDDRPYGGGVGMILRADIAIKAFNKVKNQRFQTKTITKKSKIILTSPKGRIFNQRTAINYSKLNHLIIFAGHYEGVDERVLDYIDEEVSLGDFVMTGGEITAAAITDAIVRLLPNVLKKKEATAQESFFEISIDKLIDAVGSNKTLLNLQRKGVLSVKLLEYPQYTRPQVVNGKSVPDVLLNGNHREIEVWRIKSAFEETLKKRKDLLLDK